MSKILVLGAGGFIGNHLVARLKEQGHLVVGADLKEPEYSHTKADVFHLCDLRDQESVKSLFQEGFDEVYQLAADMGGAGYIFTGTNDIQIMHNSCQINLNVIDQIIKHGIKKVFFSSSACVYPERNQLDPDNPLCSEDTAYPADPDSEYGWEKLFSERLYLTLHRNFGTDVKIARYHNIFGPESCYQGGREKSPAAICRKVAEAADGTSIEIWGDGRQTRSFLHISECLDATLQLMSSNIHGPINIGSEEMVTINQLAEMAIKVSGKHLAINHISGPTGVRGRNSDNTLIRQQLNWDYSQPLEVGIQDLYTWIADQIENSQ